MAQGMELWRPDWFKIMKGCCFNQDGSNMHANELVSVTRETARLGLSALQAQGEDAYYHNYGAARNELLHVLGEKSSVTARPAKRV